MKTAYFSTLGHGRTRQPATSWPVPNELFDPDQALRMQDEDFTECRLADEMGFDWVSIAEHHYSAGSPAPSIGAAHSLPIAAGPRFVKLTLDFFDSGEFFVVNPGRE